MRTGLFGWRTIPKICASTAILLVQIGKTVMECDGIIRACGSHAYEITFHSLGFRQIEQSDFLDVPSNMYAFMAMCSLLDICISCYFYFPSIGKLRVQIVAICGYLEPLPVIFLKETILPLQNIGAVFIIGGAIYGELIKKKEIECESFASFLKPVAFFCE